ncbi:hypothetical protein [Penaeicola halotolerans]|uniref:hypothetical protein n=1 Tax=Penaeicola halotolerans TaxID=2793196 RepID=UPI001CF894FF|nr:hypothetical protein [Penaeicola halotolerans]
MSHQSCSICRTAVKPNNRYPNYVCSTCATKATDQNGKFLKFSNLDYHGGFLAKYQESGELYNSHTCYIDGIACHADEAYFGGIVIEKIS